MLVFFTDLWSSYGISSQIFGLILSFLSNSRLLVVLNRASSQEYPVNTRFPQGSVLGPTPFLLYMMAFLMTLSVILLSMLMILCSTLTVIRHLICGNNWNWLLNLNLIYVALWTGAGIGLLISMLEKLNWFCLTSLITLVLLIWKRKGLFFRKKIIVKDAWVTCLF